MPGDSQKHRDFVREPLKDASGTWKPVSAVAGVGPAAADALSLIGFSEACHLVGHFLVLNRDEELFVEWLADNVPCMSAACRKDCHAAICEWVQQNM